MNNKNKKEVLSNFKKLLERGFDEAILLTNNGMSTGATKLGVITMLMMCIQQYYKDGILDDNDIEVLMSTIKDATINEKSGDTISNKINKLLDEIIKEL